MMDRSKSLLLVSVAALLLMMPQTVYSKDSDGLEFTKDSLDTVKKNVREGQHRTHFLVFLACKNQLR